MKKITLILCALSFLFSTLSAKEIVTKAEIDSLIEKDDAVVLNESVVCKLKSRNRIEYKYSAKILIKNNKAEHYGRVRISESEYVEADDIEARLTDILGNEIKELKGKDIKESSMSSYNSYSDDKTKSFKLLHAKFPYIMELSYKKDIESLFFWPGWFPQSDVPVLKASYKLVMDKQYPFRFYTIGMDIQPERKVEDGDSVYYWSAENIPARAKEDFLPPENKIQMAVLFAPETFEISDSRGSTKSWKDLGKWSWELNKDRLELSPESQTEVKKLIEGVDDPYEKIRILYKYLQSSSRYVAVEIELGGWQPYPAEDTFKNKYGDCKDLSALMVAMLKVAGIDGYMADARMRRHGVVIEEFPSPMQFNHVITFVPMKEDSLWLECTADYLDIHDMPYNIEDINALVIKEDGGELIHTPTAPSSENCWMSNTAAEIELQTKTINVNSRIVTTGKQKHWFRDLYKDADSEDQKIALQGTFSRYTPNLTIDQYKFSEIGDKVKNVCIKFDGEYKKSFAKSGSRIFLNPNLFRRETSDDIPDEDIKERKFPVYFYYPYQEIDTVSIRIPMGYQMEAAPPPLVIDKSFARYEIRYKLEDQKLFYVRKLEYKTKHFAKELYGEFVDFVKAVVKNDNSKFVFKR